MSMLPKWVLILLLVMALVFVGQASYRTYLDVQRQVQDDWLRSEVLRQQGVMNQALQEIRGQVEQSISRLDDTWQRVLATQQTVEKTEEKLDAAKRSLQEGHGGRAPEP